MITTISFELAKLLKEKGFEERTKSYTEDGKLVTVSLTIRRFNLEKIYYPAPTIAEVVMWLYEKHGIWVYPRPVLDEDGEWIFKGYVKLMANFKAKEIQTKLMRQPTEAYESGIEYILNNLI